MNTFDELLTNINNRELATYIWLFIFGIIILSVKSLRTGIAGVFRIIFSYKIMIPISIMFLYILLIIYLLYLIHFWDFSLIKDSIVWLIGVGFVMFFNANKATRDDFHFKEIIKENIKLTILVEFIINLYVFSLPVEFFLLPSITFLFCLQIVSQYHEKYKPVTKFFNYLLSVIGLIIIAHAVYKLGTNFCAFATTENLQSFLFPVILTFAYMPFLYFLALYMMYEEFFVRINMAYRHHKLLARYAKWKAIRTALGSLSGIKRISKELKIFMFSTRREFNEGLIKIHKTNAKNIS